MVILQEMPQPSVIKFHLKITYLKFYWNSPGANELNPLFARLSFDNIVFIIPVVKSPIPGNGFIQVSHNIILHF